MASKAIGIDVGVARKANLVSIKAPDPCYVSCIYEVYTLVYNDVVAKGIYGSAVLSVSMTSCRFPLTQFPFLLLH